MVIGNVQDRSDRTRGASQGTAEGASKEASRKASWIPAFGQDTQEKLLAALSSGGDLVVVSSAPGIVNSVAAELVAAIFPRLHEAGFATASITAPLSLSVLHDAIREALTDTAVAKRPLVVVIEHAENLLMPTVQRLRALGALRRGGRPVLRFLLAGTAALWPALRGAGLAELEHDPRAHVRLHPELAAAVPTEIPHRRPMPQAAARHESGPDAQRLRERRPPRRRALAFAGLALAACAAAGIASAVWIVRGPALEIARTVQQPSADDRLAVLLQRQSKELTSGRLWSPPGDNLIETRHQIAALVPSLSPQGLRSVGQASAAVEAATGRHDAEVRSPSPPSPKLAPPMPKPAAAQKPPATLAPTDDPVHVTVRYSRGDVDAGLRAARILAQLRSEGVLADGPVAIDKPIEHSGVAYYFAQDRSAADRLAQHLLPDARAPGMPASGGATSRPGEISISIGSHQHHGTDAASTGRQT